MARQSWLYCPKPCCRLSVSDFLQSAVSYYNHRNSYCKLFMCHHNLNTHVFLCIFSCRTLNNFNKLSVIIVKYNKKQIN